MKINHLLITTLLAASGCWASARANASEASVLTGQAIDESGAAVPSATVMILAAGPRTGSSPLCPYNYPDCGKKTTTDAQGHFEIASLDPQLNFCIIALAPGFGPFINSSLLPEAGPASVKLRHRDLSQVPAAWHVFGRIIGPEGEPVIGATVDVEMVDRKDGSSGSNNDGIDTMAISDAQGEFHLVAHKDFAALETTVAAPGLAKRWAKLEPGKAFILRMKTGATVRGHAMFDGQPLRNVAIGLSSEERAFPKFFNGYQAATKDDGSFVFQNVPAGTKFQVYGSMDSLSSHHAALQAKFTSADDGGTVDLGDLPAKRACDLKGRVVLADGEPIPPETRLLISRDEAWDMTLVPVATSGVFDASDVPPEKLRLYVRLPGYRFSAKNPNLDILNRNGLVGTVRSDVAGLNILLEPGNPLGPNDVGDAAYADTQTIERSALRGAP